MAARKPLSIASWFRRTRRPFVAWVRKLFCLAAVAVYLGASLYGVWGWVTLSDVRRYCEQNKLDYQATLDGMIGQITGTVSVSEKGVESNTRVVHTDEPIYRWTIPFQIGPSYSKQTDGSTMVWGGFQGAMLEPFIALSDNTANGVCSMALGCLISLVIVFVESLKEKPVTAKRLLLRPIAGMLGSLCTYLIILSGGAIIWNQAAGVSGLSLGIISAIGTIYVEKLTSYATFTT